MQDWGDRYEQRARASFFSSSSFDKEPYNGAGLCASDFSSAKAQVFLKDLPADPPAMI